ncbi:TetR/AcrR family transcriptional regulator [Sulfurimonas sp.]|uniref:TetR/AcrR family transcriptional regulator n=1 Tax=Sulfurimonas sp. TaxID=2022749 RepID=UPI0035693A88
MNKTKKLLIDITFDLLYKKGYCATSMSDILDIAKLTKGAMYYHFSTKDVLILATMEHYLEPILTSGWIEPLKQSEKPLETITKQIDEFYAMYADKSSFLSIKHGCPLNNFIIDMSDKNEEFFTYLKSVYKRWEDSVTEALQYAQDLNQTKTKFDAKSKSLFIISSIEGSIGTAKAYNDLDALRKSFDVLNSYILEL